MSIPQDLKFTIWGFSPKRMAYVLSVLSIVLVPVHSYLPCEASVGLGGFALMLALVTGILCWLIPREAPRRLVPYALALAAFLAHLASVH
jgi:hypothetical protein